METQYCVKCNDTIMEDYIYFGNQYYCSLNCLQNNNTNTSITEPVPVLYNNFINETNVYPKSISYFCTGCNNKYYNSEKPRITIGGKYWCSDKCRTKYNSRNLCVSVNQHLFEED